MIACLLAFAHPLSVSAENILQKMEDRCRIMLELEKELNVRFDPSKFSEKHKQDVEDENEILQFYFLLVENRILKAGINNFSFKLPEDNEMEQVKEGQEIAFTFIRDFEESLIGATIKFSTYNVIPRATISKINQEETDDTMISLIGTDTNPIYFCYKAYRNREDVDRITGLEEIKIDEAKTISELIEEFDWESFRKRTNANEVSDAHVTQETQYDSE